jgi:hypothetical protein
MSAPRLKARLLSAEYSSLPLEDAAIWQKASVDDRVRYNREMLSYVPPAQVSGDGGDATADRSDDDSIVADDEAVAVESRPAPKKPKKGERCHWFLFWEVEIYSLCLFRYIPIVLNSYLIFARLTQCNINTPADPNAPKVRIFVICFRVSESTPRPNIFVVLIHRKNTPLPHTTHNQPSMITKKPLSSWHFFTNGRARRQVLAQHPGSTARDVMGLLSSQYKALLEEERAVLDERANADRERYEMEMLAYEANGGYIAD